MRIKRLRISAYTVRLMTFEYKHMQENKTLLQAKIHDYKRHMYNLYVYTFVMQSFITYVIHMMSYNQYICMCIRCIHMYIFRVNIGLWCLVWSLVVLWYITEFITLIDTHERT